MAPLSASRQFRKRRPIPQSTSTFARTVLPIAAHADGSLIPDKRLEVKRRPCGLPTEPQ